MKATLLFTVFATVLSSASFAADDALELLAGIEAGVDTNSAMTISDLDKTQEILGSQVKGSVSSWYNIDTTTHYDIKIGEHFSLEQRPCIDYKLTIHHDSKTKTQDLKACMNYAGAWISHN